MVTIVILDKDLNYLHDISSQAAQGYEHETDMVISCIETENATTHKLEVTVIGLDRANVLKEENKLLLEDNKLFSIKDIKSTSNGDYVHHEIIAYNIVEELYGEPVILKSYNSSTCTAFLNNILTGTNFTVGVVDPLIVKTLTAKFRPDGDKSKDVNEIPCDNIKLALEEAATKFECEFVCRNQTISAYKNYQNNVGVVVQFGFGLREIVRESTTIPVYSSCQAIMRLEDQTQLMSTVITDAALLTKFRKDRRKILNVGFNAAYALADLDKQATEYMRINGKEQLQLSFKMIDISIDPNYSSIRLGFGDTIKVADNLSDMTVARVVECKYNHLQPENTELSVSKITYDLTTVVNQQINSMSQVASDPGHLPVYEEDGSVHYIKLA